jgi:hypothetical protein
MESKRKDDEWELLWTRISQSLQNRAEPMGLLQWTFFTRDHEVLPFMIIVEYQSVVQQSLQEKRTENSLRR